MMDKGFRRLSAGCVLVVSCCVAAWAQATEMSRCDLHFSGGIVIEDVPQAVTVQQRQQGLSKRTSAGNGMLFSWPDADVRVFWMRDTWIPLSIAFIAADGRIVNIRDMQPDTDDHHPSGAPVQHALELDQGQFEQLGLETGARLLRLDCRPQ